MIGTVIWTFMMSLCFYIGWIFFAKCYLNKSILLDKKNVLLLLVASLLDVVGQVSHVELANFLACINVLLLGYCFFRGGTGKIKRLLSSVEVFLFYVSIVFYMITMYMIYHPEDTELTFLDTVLDTSKWQYAYCVLILFFIVYTYVNLYRKKITLELQIREKLLFVGNFLFLISFFCLWSMLTEDGKVKLPDSFSVLCMCMLTVLEFLAFVGLVKGKLTDYYKKGQEYQQEYMEMELAHFREYKRAQDETKRVRHDMKNNLACISMLLENGKNQEAKDYVTQLLGEVNAFSPKVVTGDEMLDAIVASKWNKMEEKQITFSMEGVLDKGLNWKPIDICTVFSNGLDNAIEACEKIEGERSISLSLRYTRNFYYITISNTMAGNLPISESEKRLSSKLDNKEDTARESVVIGSRYTTKKNKELHGYGLENMERTIRKYDGTMNILQEGNRFVLKIMVPFETVV